MKLLILAACFGLFAASAHAQQDARARFEAGVAAYDAKDYQSALAAFSDAYRIKPHPVVRLNIANCYERLGRHTEAEEQYKLFLQEMPESPKASEVKRSLARISKRIGTIHLDIAPPDARVTINGEVVESSEPHRVNAGRYRVEASAPGYASRTEEVAVPGGSEPNIRIHLEPDASASETDSLADLGTDEEPSGDSYGIEDGDFSEGSESRESSEIPTGTWIAGGVAVALAAGALTTGLMAVSAESDFEDEVQRSNDLSLSSGQRRQAYQDGVDAADRADSFALVSDLLLVGAAAAATTAVILFITREDDEQNDEILSALPVLTPDGAGAVLRSTF